MLGAHFQSPQGSNHRLGKSALQEIALWFETGRRVAGLFHMLLSSKVKGKTTALDVVVESMLSR
jgi:hypothetical protein